MGISPAVNGELEVNRERQIISRFVPEVDRIAKTSTPGHLELLAEELGVKKILTRPMAGVQEEHPGIDAMLVPLPQGYSVVINEKAPQTRRAYSLAHELAHIMLLEAEDSTESLARTNRYRSASSAAQNWKTEERLCDAIAAELLMPEKMFTAEVGKLGHSLKHLTYLANLFGTSLTATAIRYWELLSEPCYLIRWKPKANGRDPILPSWQMRNKSRGPRICPVTASSVSRRNEFRTLRGSWKTMGTLISNESLLLKYMSAGKRYIRPETFETESFGFGGPENRTVLSAVYLGRNL